MGFADSSTHLTILHATAWLCDPTGKSLFHVKRPLKKYSDFPKWQIRLYPRHPVPLKGRCATSTARGGWRWPWRVLLTGVPEADGKNVWSRCTRCWLQAGGEINRRRWKKRPPRRARHKP